MQLVYLYIEKYKNIENQGFNFSPRFKCSFEDGVLSIEEREHKSLFPENFNVTAIVGKNGSGKSSIQKIIFALIYKYYKNNTKYSFSACLVIKQNQKYYKLISNKNYNFYNNIEELKNIDFFSIHFNYMIDTWYDYEKDDKWIHNTYHRTDGYKNPLLLEPYKGHKESEQYIDIDNLEYLNVLKMLKFLKQISYKIVNFFTPTKIKYALKDGKYCKVVEKYKKIMKDNTNDSIKNILEKWCDNKNYIELNRTYILLKILQIGNNDKLFPEKIYKNFQQALNGIESFKKTIEKDSNFNFLNDLQKEYYKTLKIEQALKFEQQFDALSNFNPSDNLNSNKNDDYVNIEDVKFIDILPPWLFFDLIDDKDKSYYSLSGGEKSLLNIILNILYQIKNISQEDDKYKTINIFLDEVELGFHPEWQKRYLSIVIDTLEQFKDINFHLIFATHSPFILSDIPKENIIFLKDGKNVSDEVDINTFGANIHTLLSHGFFMENGLMGEFAKKRINEVIKFLNDKESEIKSKDEAKNIINKIGEPFLKQKLMQKYEEKFQEDLIDEKIKELEKQIRELKNVKNRNK